MYEKGREVRIMDSEQKTLTPAEKREKRFEAWLTPPDIEFNSPEAKKNYHERLQRITDAYRMIIPDRVPVSLPIGNFPAYYAGVSLKLIMYDYEEMYRVWDKYLRDFEMDSYTAPAMVLPGRVYDLLDYKGYNWPGHGLPDDATGHAVAKLLMEPSYARDRLTKGVYQSVDPDDAYGQVEYALQRTLEADPIEKRLYEAGHQQHYDESYTEWVARMLSEGYINSEQASILNAAEAAVAEAIRVDDFPQDEKNNMNISADEAA